MKSFRSTFALAVALLISGLAGALPAAAADAKPRKPPPVPTANVDLNTADPKTLELLPGVTPGIAKAIIAARPFTSVNELDKIPGLATEQLESLKAAVTVSAAPKHIARILPPGAPARKPEPEKIDLNTAGREKLEGLPGATPQAVEAIIAARPFSTIDELDRVKGLTAEQLEQLRAAVVVSPSKSPPR